MCALKIDSVIAVVPAKEQDTAVAWYSNLLGREADIVPAVGVAEWKLADNAWLQVTTEPGHAGSTSVIFGVSDLETQRAACADAGVSIGEVVEYAGVVKTAEAVDPDGNKVIFAQALSS